MTARVRNIASGPRGAYCKGAFVQAAPGEEIEADDFAPEWFELVEADPLDHDGDGRKGGARRKPRGEVAPDA